MFRAYIDFIKSLILSIPFTAFDYAVFVIFAFYVYEDISFGLFASGISLVSTVASFFIGISIYSYVSSILVNNLSLTKGIADAVAFLATSFIGFIVITFILAFIKRRYVSFTFPKKLDILGGFIFGSLSFLFIASFAVSLLLSFPTSSVVKDSIRNSVSGKFFSGEAQGIDQSVKKVFGGAIEDTINFLTVKPDSNESVNLHFKTTSYKVDTESEQQMFEMVNQQRAMLSEPSFSQDESLTQLARSHAKDMLARGYFSHYTPEGLSPFDRMAQRDIGYQYAGENLAFAQDVTIAMDGLMKSPGHRANILSPNFRKVGIGVLDAGVYGKMFVQEFTD